MIQASESINLLDESTISSGSPTSGKGGNIFIETNRLNLTRGAFIDTGTLSGTGGKIEIQASDRVMLSNGAAISSSALQGRGGDIDIITRLLEIWGGSQIIATAQGQQPSGNISITASDSINLSGISTRGFVPQPSSISNTTSGSGNAGEIALKTENLSIQSGASIQASSRLGSGQAGFIEIEAKNIQLQDEAQILTETALGEGGDISIALGQSLLMSQDSLINTTAGLSQQGIGSGGNIEIGTPFLIALPENNSDIVANAFGGDGGNITINADAILNFDLQDEPKLDALRNNRTNDISASSQFGSSGTLSLNGLNTDPTQSVSELPIDLINPVDQISRRCSADRTAQSQNEFFITGNGGLPPRPGDATPSHYSTGSISSTNPTALAPTAQTAVAQPPKTNPLQEADGWKRDRQGNLHLIASRSQLPNLQSQSCSDARDR